MFGVSKQDTTASERSESLFRWLYQNCYILGAQVLRLSHRIHHSLSVTGRRCGRLLYRVFDFLLLRHARRIGAECRRFIKGFAVAGNRVREGFSRGFAAGLITLLCLPYWGIRRHATALKNVFNLLLPLSAALMLLFTVDYWCSRHYVMEVEYRGERLGYVEKASTFMEGIVLADERLEAAAENAQLNTSESENNENTVSVNGGANSLLTNGVKNIVPQLQLTTTDRALLMDVHTVCDRILKQEGDAITELSGLYINGKFEGALATNEELDSVLEEILGHYATGVANERAEFIPKVEVVDGLYPSASVMSPVDLKKRLTAQQVVAKYYEIQSGDSLRSIARKFDMTLSELQALNPKAGDNIYVGDKLLVQRPQPYLQVQTVRTITYEEEIAYKTEKVKDPTEYSFYERVKTSGKNGVQKITAEVVLVDGIEQSRKVVSTKVVKQPVNRVLVVGSKEINPNATKGEATGMFIWPVPGHTRISSDYYDVDPGARGRYGVHGAIDINDSRIKNATIVASDGGRVVEAVWGHWSYGNYITIDHGGGIKTRYAHCSTLLVKTGEKVKQGQAIAKVGDTGATSAYHLHFEVRVNGVRKNPMNYISR